MSIWEHLIACGSEIDSFLYWIRDLGYYHLGWIRLQLSTLPTSHPTEFDSASSSKQCMIIESPSMLIGCMATTSNWCSDCLTSKRPPRLGLRGTQSSAIGPKTHPGQKKTWTWSSTSYIPVSYCLCTSALRRSERSWNPVNADFWSPLILAPVW